MLFIQLVNGETQPYATNVGWQKNREMFDSDVFSVMLEVPSVSWFRVSAFLPGSGPHGFPHDHTASACVWNGERTQMHKETLLFICKLYMQNSAVFIAD